MALVTFYHSWNRLIITDELPTVSFLVVHKAFDALPHAVLLRRLLQSAIFCRAFQYVRVFWNGRFLPVRMGKYPSSLRPVSQRGPEEGVLSSLQYNIAMAAFTDCIQSFRPPTVRIVLNPGDIVLWHVALSRLTIAVRNRLQKFLPCADAYLQEIDLTLSHNTSLTLPCL